MDLERLSRDLRSQALTIAHNAGKHGAHLGGGLSVIEILATLYGRCMRHSSSLPSDPDRDRLIVSKGHCVLAYYAALNHFGYLTDGDIAGFEVNGSDLHGHATRSLSRGIEFSGGSLSLGASFAVGVALALDKKGCKGSVFALVGDGECDEGLVWEALMAAANFKLDRLTVIVDANQLQYDGMTSQVMDQGSLAEKFSAFGFMSIEVDGHNVSALSQAFETTCVGRPKAVIAHTVKGKGVSFMENKREWHHSILTTDQYHQAINEQRLSHDNL